MVVADNTGGLTTADSPVRHGPCPPGNHALRTRPANTTDRPSGPTPAGDLTHQNSRNEDPMSTETGTTMTPENTDPARDALAELPASCRAVRTELLTLTEPKASADIAQAAGLGRSTAGKALVILEKLGLAHRTPGGHDGPQRTPDLWQATATEAEAPETAPAPDSQEATPDSSPDMQETDPDTAPAADAETLDSEPTAATNDTVTASAPPPAVNDEPFTPDAKAAGAPVPHTKPEGAQVAIPSPRTEVAPNPVLVPAPRTAPTPAPTPAADHAVTLAAVSQGRLAPGGLRQLVAEYLTSHPGEAFTATRISRAIDRSSGAIANALVTLAKQGLAEQVGDRPRTYRATTPNRTA